MSQDYEMYKKFLADNERNRYKFSERTAGIVTKIHKHLDALDQELRQEGKNRTLRVPRSLGTEQRPALTQHARKNPK